MEKSLEEASTRNNGADGPQPSLMSALFKFVSEVNKMEEAVMIPSKLRDMEVGDSAPALMEQNNNKTVLPNLPAGADLYSFYSMLNTVKHEIVSGSMETSDASEVELEDNADETSKDTAAAFRHHLKGIFGLLSQLTETAKFLTNRYEGEITKTSGNVSSFAL